VTCLYKLKLDLGCVIIQAIDFPFINLVFLGAHILDSIGLVHI